MQKKAQDFRCEEREHILYSDPKEGWITFGPTYELIHQS